MIIHLMIQFCTWKAAGTTLAPAEGTVRAVESVRDLGRAMINFSMRRLISVQCDKYDFPSRDHMAQLLMVLIGSERQDKHTF